MALNISQTNPTGTIKSTSVRTHAWGAGELVNTTQNTAQGAARTSVIRDAHDIVRGNLIRGIDNPYLRAPRFAIPAAKIANKYHRRLRESDGQTLVFSLSPFCRMPFLRHQSTGSGRSEL